MGRCGYAWRGHRLRSGICAGGRKSGQGDKSGHAERDGRSARNAVGHNDLLRLISGTGRERPFLLRKRAPRSNSSPPNLESGGANRTRFTNVISTPSGFDPSGFAKQNRAARRPPEAEGEARGVLTEVPASAKVAAAEHPVQGRTSIADAINRDRPDLGQVLHSMRSASHRPRRPGGVRARPSPACHEEDPDPV